MATFDPTIYRNGIHELRLWAQDLAGNEAFVDGCLLLDGRFKVGQASIGGSSAEQIQMAHGYTSSGQIASVTDSHGTTQYQYDSDERLNAVTDANGAAISYTYNAFGRRQTVTTPSGTTGYGYDTYGRLISVTDPDGAKTRYTYDEHGNKASMISPNGTITLNRLISVETRTMTNDLLAAYSYTLNAKGQRTHVEEQPIGVPSSTTTMPPTA